MWYTARYEGFDAPRRKASAPRLADIYTCLLSYTLRCGFLLKWIGLTGLMVSYHYFGGLGFFTYNLIDTTEEQRNMFNFRRCLIAFEFICFFGSAQLLIFQACLSDDVTCARGFRSGSKLFGVGVFFDLISNIIQFAVYLHLYLDYTKEWWLQATIDGVEVSFLTLSRLFHAFALLYLAFGAFLLEAYYDYEGERENLIIINAVLLCITGIGGTE